MLLLGDCNHWLKEIKDNSIDLIVTDPPYGIEFMGKDWDKALVHTETWKECYRVLKEGKLAFIMCSPRQDVLSRMIVNLQDAGFRTNYTSIYWTYASGFPKAANVSKLLDKRNGRDENINIQLANYLKQKRQEKGFTREYMNDKLGVVAAYSWYESTHQPNFRLPTKAYYEQIKTILELDNRFDELIEREEAEREIIARSNQGIGSDSGSGIYQLNNSRSTLSKEYDITKPATEEAKKMEGAYVGFQPKPAVEIILTISKGKTLTWLDNVKIPEEETERFPANLLVSDNVLDDYSRYFSLDAWADKTFPFIITPKASRSERGEFNNHPTVKSLKLMSYLITMGSREGDLVLDPFCGSGTVCIAADQLHRKWIGIEKNPEYAEIIKKRLMVPLSQLKLELWARE